MTVFKRFSGCNRGNIAITFAIIGAPLIILAGLGIDYSRMARTENTMQKTLDNAADSYGDLRYNRISAAHRIQEMVRANTGRDTARVRIRIERDKLKIEAMDIVDTPMLSTIGRPRMPVFASTEVDASRYSGSQPGEMSARNMEVLEKRVNDLMRELGVPRQVDNMNRRELQRLQRQLERQMQAFR